MLIRYPPTAAAGRTPNQLVLSIDLAPTLLALAGATPTATMQGRSLLPLLQGNPTPWRTSFLIEYYTDTAFPRIRDMGYQAVRTERHKCFHYLELNGMDELYDLERDPYEMDNIIDAPAGRAVLPRLKTELTKLQMETGYTPARATAGSR